MTKYKVAELDGALLDWAVAVASGFTGNPYEGYRRDHGTGAVTNRRHGDHGYFDEPFRPSVYWADGGPIIDRDGISLERITTKAPHVWSANFEICLRDQDRCDYHTGPAPLVAAMRAYVYSMFGDEVDLP